MSTVQNCDSDSKTTDLRHQTEEPKRPEIAWEDKSKSGIEREISPLSEVKEG
jgi:hypothetical protein